MAASSSSPLFGIREEDSRNQMKPQLLPVPQPTLAAASPPPQQQKKKRNLPGTPNPDAEIIALSPKTLMATNRFICEVCNKGFQREQNLQLHRRGHNLPWKLRQKSTKEVKRKVYLCPEQNCVHHDPSRALGDLTGIKKHFCRKHGEKKWKCEKCSKRYAVQSDWKAHSKTCGTREYRCDCGTLFSRRDSFITHRAFCDALAQESVRLPPSLGTIGSNLFMNSNMGLSLPQVNSQNPSLHDQTYSSADILHLGGSRGLGNQFEHLISSNPSSFRQPQPGPSSGFFLDGSNQEMNEGSQHNQDLLRNKPLQGLMQLPNFQGHTNPNYNSTTAINLFNLGFMSNSSCTSSISNSHNSASQNRHVMLNDQFDNESGGGTDQTTLLSNHLGVDNMSSDMPSLFNSSMQGDTVLPQMSATALLQKAAQMGATTSTNGPSLRGFDCSTSSIGAKGSVAFRGHTGDNMRPQSFDNENNFQDLMNSLASANSGMYGGISGMSTAFGNGNVQTRNGFNGFNANFGDMNEAKLHNNMPVRVMGGSDGLTRDFLGVGGVVRSMAGGISERERQHGLVIGSFDSEMKANSTGRTYPGGNMQ